MSKESAFPQTTKTTSTSATGVSVTSEAEIKESGLSKREYFYIRILQGLLSNPNNNIYSSVFDYASMFTTIALQEAQSGAENE